MSFDTILIVDWSGGNDRGPKPKKDAIWVCAARGGIADEPIYLRNRQVAEDWINKFLNAERATGRSVMAGFDFAFGFPTGFGKTLIGSDDPFAIWDWFEHRVKDAPESNNRFDLAGQINALFPGVGPFWGNALQRDIPDLPRKGLARHGDHPPEKRAAEENANGTFPVWQLSGAGAVGSQVIMGLPVLARLRKRFDVAVWPFEPLSRAIAFVEVWPSLIAKTIAASQPKDKIKDAHQVFVFAQTLSQMPAPMMQKLLNVPVTKEGAILGVGQEALLRKVALVAPPTLRNDCFAMPQGAYWTPVDDALQHLKKHLTAVTGTGRCSLKQASGRILAEDVTALRAHPPSANAAVDGYAFAGPAGVGVQNMPLVSGRAAAGQPYQQTVPRGHAIRILTGAHLPDGVDTIVLQEDVTATETQIAFHGPLKNGANTRNAGEDVNHDDRILSAGRVLTPADLAFASAVGVSDLKLQTRLRVGVLSTGDELRDPGETTELGQIYDANRPMLCAAAQAWGYEVIDLGRAPDDPKTLKAILDEGTARCDVILTSGGASAGDEDHMSTLLQNTGSLALWRIAMKPGRPLALGIWNETPVFGLPGNPVAALVCALIFAYPALRVMAGADWESPQGFMVPAGFTKSKKDGRREYLRARIVDGQVAVFASEGSGRISGISWATGLVMLEDHAQTIRIGDPVTFIPFSSFGL